jgi:hypothetical protein
MYIAGAPRQRVRAEGCLAVIRPELAKGGESIAKLYKAGAMWKSGYRVTRLETGPTYITTDKSSGVASQNHPLSKDARLTGHESRYTDENVK